MHFPLVLAGRANKCPFALLLRHHCPLPAALAQSKGRSAPQPVHSPSAEQAGTQQQQQQQQQSQTQQAAGLVHQPAQLGQASAEHMPSQEINTLTVPSADLLTGSIQSGDQGMGVTSSEDDASLGTPDTSPCSMEAHPMGSTMGSASASDHQGGHDADLQTAEPMTQDLVIADSDTEDDGQLEAEDQISVDGVNVPDSLVNGQLLSPASDVCNARTLQLDLSPDASPSPSRAACTAGPAAGIAMEAASVKAPASAVNTEAYTADDLQLLIRPKTDPSSHAAEVSDLAHDDAPIADTLPDSCPDASGDPGTAIAPCHPTAAEPSNCRPEQDRRLPSEASRWVASVPAASEAHVAGPSAVAKAPSCAPAVSMQTAVATADTSDEATATAAAAAKVTTLAAATEASANTAHAALAAAGDHARDGAGDDNQNAVGGAIQSAVPKHEGTADGVLNSGDPGHLQQLLLQSHVPHAAVTAFVWSAVRHIVPQVCLALHHTTCYDHTSFQTSLTSFSTLFVALSCHEDCISNALTNMLLQAVEIFTA